MKKNFFIIEYFEDGKPTRPAYKKICINLDEIAEMSIDLEWPSLYIRYKGTDRDFRMDSITDQFEHILDWNEKMETLKSTVKRFDKQWKEYLKD